MRRRELRAWLSNRSGGAPAFTLIELLVVLAILSILAMAALPYAEVATRRTKELELRRSLREIRTAIDRLHDDWQRGKTAPNAAGISIEGYPKTLDVLVEGIGLGDGKGTKRKYLRHIPPDPFAEPGGTNSSPWRWTSYYDAPDALSWGGEDVYDVHSGSTAKATDGTRYSEW